MMNISFAFLRDFLFLLLFLLRSLSLFIYDLAGYPLTSILSFFLLLLLPSLPLSLVLLLAHFPLFFFQGTGPSSRLTLPAIGRGATRGSKQIPGAVSIYHDAVMMTFQSTFT